VKRLVAVAVLAGGLSAVAAPAAKLSLPASPLTDQERILHVLNRLGYGPRPADVTRVRAMGVAAYLNQQLHPEELPNGAVSEALAAYPVLTASTAQLVRDYPRPTAPSGPRPARAGRPAVITQQIQAAAVTRAIGSEAQLEEVLVAFWFNHFNVYSQKGAVRWMVPAYERDAIRPHVLGRFRDLVLATARHPAMLFYLDNWMSRRGGLNENYARELMELHTLGVDGGYTQQDVTEVARAFTGWTIDRPRQGGAFLFRPALHDQGSKRVLGQTIAAGGGEGDGERVVGLLVRHPSTARFIATKLARYFVMDEPPAPLVDRLAATFRSSDGDIRAVMTALVTSPEFWSRQAYRAKIKTPFEVVASAMRALDGQLDPRRGGAPLAREVGRLGQPLYEAQPPTGYPDRAESWVNTGALLGRMNFALSLAHNRVRGATVDLDAVLDAVDRAAPADVLDRLLTAVLHGAATPQTRAVLTAQLQSPEITRTTGDDRGASDTDVQKLAALVLGSPEFQRR
jgi:uncharacterized protein (DUF1800 family)